MDLVEGVGESSSPARSFGGLGAYDIRNDVYNRLIESGNHEAVSNPEFREQLDVHFNRLPASYVLDINMDKVEDVLLHKKLLTMARDPENRPVFHIRFLENFWIKGDDIEDRQAFGASPTAKPPVGTGNDGVLPLHDRQEVLHTPIHKVIFSTIDKPKLLSQLSALLSDIGLNIREAHVFSTSDGYSLDVFVVEGWPVEDTEGLCEAMRKAIARNEGSWSGSSHSKSVVEGKPGDWEIDTRLLKVGDKIASGSCGDLYRGVYIGQNVAVKVLRSEHLNDTLENEFAQEVAVLRRVQHKNVVRFIGACTKSPNFWIVTEYMPGGSLYEYLHKNHIVLELPQLLKFAIDVCKGMEYLHQNNIIHRDLKTANLLMDSVNVVKVADFGVARFQCEGVMTAETGTYRWMAPEVINHQPYNQKADVFSFAIVLWELVTSKVPYDTMTPLQAALGVRQGLRPELPKDAHPKLLDLMQRCWEAVPGNRPSFSEMRIELEEFLEEVQENPEGPNNS
ncbi:hypothetical protein ACH5RR_026572 [Cinchona calisaya]|uniref:non-specific serine/threonine protein kinase n=1 Tax=Cinchona calisaya TaxID=153742 RepID=A0ABD2Z6C8_9GENT